MAICINRCRGRGLSPLRKKVDHPKWLLYASIDKEAGVFPLFEKKKVDDPKWLYASIDAEVGDFPRFLKEKK